MTTAQKISARVSRSVESAKPVESNKVVTFSLCTTYSHVSVARTQPHPLRTERPRPSSAHMFHVECTFFGRLLWSLPLLARDDVGGIPLLPVVRRRRLFVLAMVLLCFFEKRNQSRNVHVAESSSGKTRLDLLQQPAVPVRIAE